ncbi:hydroxyacylglutathione hydrolase [Hyphomicrobium sp.]|uniref:hydroxyacylglutathione hydrolase n=1 Tax=Hyphomicrobium sp. TaxID=82 RepID=UPI0025C55CE1|nr:hydroxyacylglutathione hydrolase [Hyphomicrobium sp.]MCC7253016.1 hydroxyacylglutathione hydrolase [Hyphomicrobium sp.]
MAQPEIHQFPCLKDNYGVLVHDPDRNVTLSIDAPDADAVGHALAERGWRLTHILATHHHADHTAGIPALKAETQCKIIGPKAEAARIPGLDLVIAEPDALMLGGLAIAVIDTPGHTIGHVAYWIPEAKVAFVGDTLFAMGCGRVLEGTAEMMWASLEKLARLPPDTAIYCGHEYTVSNGKFGVTIEPENTRLAERLAEAEAARAAGQPTLPTRIDLELETNVFLRADREDVRAHVGLPVAPTWKVFANLRERKNRF